jgi:cyclopropane fatty-acyl-phospholipid synthase-like methyltransferase
LNDNIQKNKTLNFYNNNAQNLIPLYNDAKIELLEKLFQKYISKDDTVLDIGFGSGRDLKIIQTITSKAHGLDACEVFIENANKTTLKGKVAKSILPNIDITNFKTTVNKFDVIISIAVLMHLTKQEIKKTICNIKEVLIDNGVVIISYPHERASTDERHFENMNKEIMTKLFNKCNFIMIEEFENKDALNRDIYWITQIYKSSNL